ncbi:unnamed protein product, partial [Protopolystoma xenopodis]
MWFVSALTNGHEPSASDASARPASTSSALDSSAAHSSASTSPRGTITVTTTNSGTVANSASSASSASNSGSISESDPMDDDEEDDDTGESIEEEERDESASAEIDAVGGEIQDIEEEEESGAGEVEHGSVSTHSTCSESVLSSSSTASSISGASRDYDDQGEEVDCGAEECYEDGVDTDLVVDRAERREITDTCTADSSENGQDDASANHFHFLYSYGVASEVEPSCPASDEQVASFISHDPPLNEPLNYDDSLFSTNQVIDSGVSVPASDIQSQLVASVSTVPIILESTSSSCIPPISGPATDSDPLHETSPLESSAIAVGCLDSSPTLQFSLPLQTIKAPTCSSSRTIRKLDDVVTNASDVFNLTDYPLTQLNSSSFVKENINPIRSAEVNEGFYDEQQPSCGLVTLLNLQHLEAIDGDDVKTILDETESDLLT